MKVGGGIEVGLHSFVTGALVEKSGELNAPASLPLGRELPTSIEYESVLAPDQVWPIWSEATSLVTAGNQTVIRRIFSK